MHKTSLLALSLIFCAVAVTPVKAEGLGSSGWVKPGGKGYVPSGTLETFLQGQVSQDMTSPIDSGGQDMTVPIQQQEMQQPMMQQPMMQQPMMQQQMQYMQQPMQMQNNQYMPATVQDSGAADGLNNALAGAAALGLAGQTAMTGIGDALRSVGFGGGFRGHARGCSAPYELSPFGGTGIGHQGPGILGGGGRSGGYGGGDYYTGSGGGGSMGAMGRQVSRALDRNIQSAADQATYRLTDLLWH